MTSRATVDRRGIDRSYSRGPLRTRNLTELSRVLSSQVTDSGPEARQTLAQALLSARFLGLAGLVYTAVLGLRGSEISRHITFGFFSAMVTPA